MKIDIEILYNADKLEKNVKGIIKETVKNLGNSFVEGSKKAIENGRFQKIGEFTKVARKQGLSPNAKNKSTSSIKPLQHTGRLLKGIKQMKNGDMIVHKYGLYHLPDDIFDITEESLVKQVELTQKAKSGVAYRIKSNKFTKAMQSRYNWKNDNLANKEVPIRNWFQMDKKIAKKAISRFHKLIKKNFKGTKSELFRLYG